MFFLLLFFSCFYVSLITHLDCGLQFLGILHNKRPAISAHAQNANTHLFSWPMEIHRMLLMNQLFNKSCRPISTEVQLVAL